MFFKCFTDYQMVGLLNQMFRLLHWILGYNQCEA